MLKVATLEEGLGWAERYGKVLLDGELEVAQVNEPWDIGVMPAPENPPLQLMLIEKADKHLDRAADCPQPLELNS